MGPRSYELRIHRSVHQSARLEISGGLSTAKTYDFSARVLPDRYQNAHIPILSLILVQNWGWDGVGLGWLGVGLGFGLGCIITSVQQFP